MQKNSKDKSCTLKTHIKRCCAILLIIFLLLSSLFVAMGKISTNDFWLSILFIGGCSILFFRNKCPETTTKTKKITKN